MFDRYLCFKRKTLLELFIMMGKIILITFFYHYILIMKKSNEDNFSHHNKSLKQIIKTNH